MCAKFSKDVLANVFGVVMELSTTTPRAFQTDPPVGLNAVVSWFVCERRKTYDNAFIAIPALASWLHYHGWS